MWLPLGNPAVQANQMRLFRICWQFAAKGGRVYLDVSAEFDGRAFQSTSRAGFSITAIRLRTDLRMHWN